MQTRVIEGVEIVQTQKDLYPLLGFSEESRKITSENSL